MSALLDRCVLDRQVLDRICQRRHHDWIEAFLVSHQSVRHADQHQQLAA